LAWYNIVDKTVKTYLKVKLANKSLIKEVLWTRQPKNGGKNWASRNTAVN
jgi:hypothetical protein